MQELASPLISTGDQSVSINFEGGCGDNGNLGGRRNFFDCGGFGCL